MSKNYSSTSKFCSKKTESRGEQAIVSTKHRLTTEAALQMLRAGGNVIDAAVAATFAAGVVEPTSSGIGGGGYLVYQLGDRGGVFGFPMRAPLAAKPDMYRLTGEFAVGSFGWPGVEENENCEGVRSVAVPGAVAGLTAAHKSLGNLPLSEVVEPAVELARYGYVPEFHDLMAYAMEIGKLSRHPVLQQIFLPKGELPQGIQIPGPGSRLGESIWAEPAKIRQPDLADTLEDIGATGGTTFYRGAICSRLINEVRQAGGLLTEKDLEIYQPFHWQSGQRFSGKPLEITYRNYRIRFPPYASGGITSAMTLQLLNNSQIDRYDHNSKEALHEYISAARLAYADRFAFLADPETADVPWNGLTSSTYATRRWTEVKAKAPKYFKAGNPWVEEGRNATVRAPGSAPSYHDGTTHLCVMDKEGNAVSLTNTLMSGFGSGVVAGDTGIILNNGMMWFDPVPGHVNSIAPRKLPLNNMSPLLVLDESGVRYAVGASGGRRITNCVTSIVVNMLDFGYGPQAAIDVPRIDCSTPLTIVDGRVDSNVIDELRARRHHISAIDPMYATQGMSPFASPVALTRLDDGLRGGADTFHSAYSAGL